MVYFFLTEVRRAQFNLAMFILEEEIKIFDKIPAFPGFSAALKKKEIPVYFELPKTALDYLNLHFFKN